MKRAHCEPFKFSKHANKSLSTRIPITRKAMKSRTGTAHLSPLKVQPHTQTINPPRTTSTHLLLAQVVHDCFSTCGRHQRVNVVIKISRQGGGRLTRSEKEGVLLPVWMCGCGVGWIGASKR